MTRLPPPNVKLSLVNRMGGMLSAAGTAVLSNEKYWQAGLIRRCLIGVIPVRQRQRMRMSRTRMRNDNGYIPAPEMQRPKDETWPLAAIDRVLAQGAQKVADRIAASFQA